MQYNSNSNTLYAYSFMYILFIFHVLVDIVLLLFETWFNHSTFYHDHEDSARN